MGEPRRPALGAVGGTALVAERLVSLGRELGIAAVAGNGWKVAGQGAFQEPMAAEQSHRQNRLMGNNPVAVVAGAAVGTVGEPPAGLAQ